MHLYVYEVEFTVIYYRCKRFVSQFLCHSVFGITVDVEVYVCNLLQQPLQFVCVYYTLLGDTLELKHLQMYIPGCALIMLSFTI